MRKTWKRAMSCMAVALAAVMAVSPVAAAAEDCITDSFGTVSSDSAYGEEILADAAVFETATEAVANMNVGWNLGNTLDAYVQGMDYTQYIGKDGTYTLLTGTTPNSAYCGGLNSYSWGQQLVLSDSTMKGALTGNGYEATFTFTFDKAATGNMQILAGNMYEFSIASLDTDKDGVVKVTSSQIRKAISSVDTSYVHFQVAGNTYQKVTCTLKSSTSSSTYTSAFETCWGNPVTTKAMIASVKAQGFGAIRIPVTYLGKIDSKGNIDSAWLDRVQQIVDWCMEEDLYCIINVHHDTGASNYVWIKADTTNYTNNKTKYENLWKQIATRFKNYDERLLFESYNEMLDASATWSNPRNSSSYTAINNYAQSFVTTVRATGGNNSNRNLVVNTYSACYNTAAVSNFTVPKDTTSNHLILQVHYYNPPQFVYAEKQDWLPYVTDTWTDAFTTQVNNELTTLANDVAKKGIPVIIGEFSAELDNNDAEQAKYVTAVVKAAKKHGITCFYWDNGNCNNSSGGCGIFNRLALTWNKTITTALIKAASEYTESSSIETPVIGTVSATASKTLQIKWTPCKASVDGYLIYRDGKQIAKVDSTQSSYKDTTIGEASYGYQVAAYVGNKRSAYSSKAISLATPTFKNVGFTDVYSATVNWNAVSGAAGYEIYRKLSGGSYEKIATVGAVDSYVDKDVYRANKYYYYIKAYKTVNGTKVYSPYQSLYTLGIPVVQNVTSSSATSNTVTFESSTGATGYAIYRKGSNESSWTKIKTVKGQTDTFTDTTVVDGISYQYRVRAYRTMNGLTYYSGYYTSMASLAMPVVKNIAASTTTTNRIYFSEVSGATGYSVYRKEVGGSFKKLGSVSGQSYYDDTTSVASTTYIYTVRAYRTNKDYGTTTYSYYRAGVQTLAQPKITVAATAKGKNTVSWDKVEGATGYYVYRKLPSGNYSLLATVKGGSTFSYADATAVSGTKYAYCVRAYRTQEGVTGRGNACTGKTVTTK